MNKHRVLLKTLYIAALIFVGVTLFLPHHIEAQDSDYPAVISTVTPTIPPIAIAARASGSVVMELNLGAEGDVISASAIEGHPLFRKSTEQAALQWRFTPAKKSGRTLRLTFVYPQVWYGESPHVMVLPYRMELKLVLPEYVKPPDTASQIPSNWRPGRDKCKVHGEVLKKDKVEIVYGLMGFREGYLEAQNRLFPNANTAAYGGCVVMTDVVSGEVSPKYAEVLYCRQCRSAERRWGHRNRRRKFTT